MPDHLLGHRGSGGFLARWIGAALALLILTACGGPVERRAPADSELRRALDQLAATREGPKLTVGTDVLLKFVPIGTPERQAIEMIESAGLPLRARYERSMTDLRCIKPGIKPDPPLPCSNPADKSENYRYFEIITEKRPLRLGGAIWTTYFAEIGIRGGVVDYVHAVITTDFN